MQWQRGIVGVIFMLGACIPPSEPSATEDADTPCDGKKDCDTCIMCASRSGCAAVQASCLDNSACAGIDQCMSLCGADLGCQQQCYSNNPTGVSAYNAWSDCFYCDQCPSDCRGFQSCN